jgi:hypothetical protein
MSTLATQEVSEFDKNSHNEQNDSATYQGENDEAILQKALQMSMSTAVGETTNSSEMYVADNNKQEASNDEAAQLANIVSFMMSSIKDTMECFPWREDDKFYTAIKSIIKDFEQQLEDEKTSDFRKTEAKLIIMLFKFNLNCEEEIERLDAVILILKYVIHTRGGTFEDDSVLAAGLALSNNDYTAALATRKKLKFPAPWRENDDLYKNLKLIIKKLKQELEDGKTFDSLSYNKRLILHLFKFSLENEKEIERLNDINDIYKLYIA